MTDGLLAEIILLEKELQVSLSAEEQRCQGWRDRELAQLDHALEKAREAADGSGQRRIEQARVAAEQEAEALLRRTRRWCKVVDTLSEEVLRDSLRRHLAGVLPEVSHDHPHGES